MLEDQGQEGKAMSSSGPYLRYGFNPRLPPHGVLPFPLISSFGMRAPCEGGAMLYSLLNLLNTLNSILSRQAFLFLAPCSFPVKFKSTFHLFFYSLYIFTISPLRYASFVRVLGNE